MRTVKNPVLREWLLILLLLSAGVIAAARYDWFQRLDQSTYDFAMRLWERPVTPDVVIVGIDEASLNQIGRWPWRRVVHAALLDRLAAARPAAIAVDIIFSEADRRDQNADALLGAAVSNAERVILPVIPAIDEGRIVGEAPPVEVIRAGAAALAQIQSQTDSDGVLRSVHLMGGAGKARYRLMGYEAIVQSRLYPGFGRPVRTQEGDAEQEVGAWQRDQRFLVPFVGPPGQFKVVPYVNVLRGDVPASTFANKIVLIGLTAGGLGDEYPTPVSGQSRAMAGIEIHANVIQALVEGVRLKTTGPVESALIALLALVVVMCGYLWLTPRQSIVLAGGSLIVIAIAAAVIFRHGMVWISPTIALIAVGLSYPLWSWRKLEATQRYFDAELARLNAEPDVLPAATLTAIPGMAKQKRSLVRVPDVIERRIEAVAMATDRLRNLKRFVADSLENLPTATLVVDFNGRILLSNSMANQMFIRIGAGRTPDGSVAGLEGHPLTTVLAALRPEESGVWEQLLPGLLAPTTVTEAGTDATPVTVEAKSIDMQPERDCVVQFAPLANHKGVKTGLIITIADITPLRESERRRDEALRFLSHDMRSPQASIITLLEMVKEDPGSIPQATLLERIGKYSRRTLNLADDFLRLAKAERAKSSDFSPLELTEILQDVVDEGEAMARGKSMQVVMDAEVDEAWISGDRDLVTRAIINLLSNAIKYSPESTTVTIRLATEPRQDKQDSQTERWRVDVADEGMGIAPENMARLFQRFQRLHQEGQPKTDGIGLGLVFVKTVIERMGGEVRVASQVMTQPGDAHGTTFSIVLPQIDPDA